MTTRHPSIHKSWHKISSTSGGHSVGIVRLRTKGHGVRLFFLLISILKHSCLLGHTPHGHNTVSIYGLSIFTIYSIVLQSSPVYLSAGSNSEGTHCYFVLKFPDKLIIFLVTK
jgi:hypothetical protein